MKFVTRERAFRRSVLKNSALMNFPTRSEGQGLGVYHAKKCVEELGGRLDFKSTLGEGTSAILKLPCDLSSEVYQLQEDCFEHQTYIVVDDDPSVHNRALKSNLWKNKDAEIKCYFSFPKRFSRGNEVFFFVDYDLKDESPNGIELIKNHNLKDRALLVTSYYNRPEIVHRCMREGIKILPKVLL